MFVEASFSSSVRLPPDFFRLSGDGGNFYSREFSGAKQGSFYAEAGNFRWRIWRPASDVIGMKKRRSVSGSPRQTSEVGYRRPPKDSRWKLGQSGNPNGKKALSLGNRDSVEMKAPVEEVGYKKPPVHSRWRKGQSGNPRGSKPRDILQEVLLSPFPVKIGGTTEYVPALDVMLLRIRAKAVRGDQKTIRSLIELFASPAMTRHLLSSEPGASSGNQDMEK